MPGLPKKYIKKYGVSKKAWAAYRKDQKSNKRITTKKKSIRVKRVARRRTKKRSRRKGKRRIPLLPFIGGVVAPAARIFSAVGGMSRLESDPMGFLKGCVDQIGLKFTGIHFLPGEAGLPTDKINFQWDEPLMTYGGLLLGALGSKAATKVGINRQIARIPIVGDYIKL